MVPKLAFTCMKKALRLFSAVPWNRQPTNRYFERNVWLHWFFSPNFFPRAVICKRISMRWLKQLYQKSLRCYVRMNLHLTLHSWLSSVKVEYSICLKDKNISTTCEHMEIVICSLPCFQDLLHTHGKLLTPKEIRSGDQFFSPYPPPLA